MAEATQAAQRMAITGRRSGHGPEVAPISAVRAQFLEEEVQRLPQGALDSRMT